MRNLLLLLLLCMSLSSNAQSKKPGISNQPPKMGVTTALDSLVKITNRINFNITTQDAFEGRYKLYKTENIYTFLKLDTATGIIDQIQWSMDSNKEGKVASINSTDLSLIGGTYKGRFELYPTQNIYTFILLDTWFGKTWHVQWNINSDNRGIIPID